MDTHVNFQNLRRILKLRNLLSLSIPVGVIVANLFFPLSPILHQGLIGVMLLWLFAEATNGFTLFTETTPPENKHEQEVYNVKKTRFAFSTRHYAHSLYALLIVAVTTVLLLLIGRSILGEAVIAMVYLVPVIWSTVRWGQMAGLVAALAAAMFFDFYFIPPFFTFTVGSVEGWLVLGIFLMVAGVMVGRIQTIIQRAQDSEHEARLMYELSNILAEASSQKAIINGVARFLQQRYLATLVTVSIRPRNQELEIAAYEPQNGIVKGKPDRLLALLDPTGSLIGEIQIWHGMVDLPAEDSRLFQNFASQVGHVLERTYVTQAVSVSQISSEKK